jgi:hypothetical protein
VKIAQPLERERCLELLTPHLLTLDACFRSAWMRWRTWLEALDGSPADITARSRASALYDLIAAEATTRFLGVDHVRVRRERGFLVLRFHDQLALRFKKFRGRTLRTSSISTRQAVAFDAQTLEVTEGGIGTIQPLTHVVAGYVLDDLALDFDMLAITCTLFGEHLWAPIEIITEGEDDSAVVPMPRADTDGPVPTVHSTRKTTEKSEVQ